MRVSEFQKKLNEITKAKGRFAFQVENLQNYTYRFINIDEAWKQVNFFNTVGFGFNKDKQTTDFLKKCIEAKQNVMVINSSEKVILQKYETEINSHINSLQSFLKLIALPKPSNNSFSISLLLNDKQEIKINDLIKVLNWVSRIGKFIKNIYQIPGDEIINISSCEYGSFNLDFNIVDIATIVIWVISSIFWIWKKVKGKDEENDTNNKDDILLENEYLKKELDKNGIENKFDLEKARIHKLAEELFNNKEVELKGQTNINEFKNALWVEYTEFKKEKIAEICEFKLSLNSNEDKLIEYSDNNEIKRINTEEILRLIDDNKNQKDK